jgi:hypothetical protein
MVQREFEENELIEEFFQLGIYTEDDLAKFLIDNLVHPGLYADFGRQVVKNLVSITYQYFSQLEEQQQRAHFLKILIKLTWVGFSMKRWVFNLSREDAPQTYAKAPLFFSFMSKLTDPLESIRRELAAIDSGLISERLLLVEGASEATFIETIQLSSDLLNFDFDVYSFNGKGNIGNLVHLIREKNRQGIRVDLSYDLDGKSSDFESKLTTQCKVESSFAFTRDFENAFPASILGEAVNHYIQKFTSLQVKVDPEQIKAMLSDKLTFIDVLSRFLRIAIKKPKLGGILAELTLADGSIWNEVTNEQSVKTEIAKFLRFVMLW